MAVRYFAPFLVLMLSLTGHAQQFSSLLTKLEGLPSDKRQVMVDSFLKSCRQFPIVESDTNVYFVCRNSAKEVRIAGDATAWKPDLMMTPVEGTRLHYSHQVYPRDARLEYKYILDGSQWILDSLNPNIGVGGYGTKSVLMMPDYTVPPEFMESDSRLTGQFDSVTLYSRILQENRVVRIYLPTGYNDSGKMYQLILFHDGDDYLQYTHIREILDNLNQEGMPLLAVFVVPVHRDAEYSGNLRDQYAGFIAKELYPRLQKTYRIKSEPECHASAGISNGGNASLYLAMKHPDVFGRVIAQSSNIESYIMHHFKKHHSLPSMVYLNIGKYDIPELRQMYTQFTTILSEQSMDFLAEKYPEGHNWGFWDAKIKRAIMFVFPPH